MNWARLLAVPLAIGTVYFALTEGQWIHWFSGPLTLALIFFGTPATNDRLWRELASWRKASGNVPRVGDLVSDKKRKAVGASGGRRVPPPPAAIYGMLNQLGGKIVDIYELVPSTAYLAVGAPNALTASEHQTVVCLLEEAAPSMRVRPLPIIEGKRQRNHGLIFSKDRLFSNRFIVEAFAGPAARSWLSKPVRKALLAMPDTWLTTQGKVMAVSAFGLAQDKRIARLVDTADVLFAEYGAGGGPPLLKNPPKKKTQKSASTSKEKTAPGKSAKKSASANKSATAIRTPRGEKGRAPKKSSARKSDAKSASSKPASS